MSDHFIERSDHCICVHGCNIALQEWNRSVSSRLSPFLLKVDLTFQNGEIFIKNNSLYYCGVRRKWLEDTSRSGG